MEGLVIVKENEVMFGSPENGLTSSSVSFKRMANEIGGQIVKAVDIREEISDTGLYCYGPAEIDVQPDLVTYTYPIISLPEDICNECLCCRARAVRDGLVDKIQSMIDNWSRKINVATRAAEDTTTLEAELADLEDFQQSLCDVPQQAGFPNTFDWPVVSVSWQSVEVSGVNIAEYYNEKVAHWSEPQE